MRMGVIVVAVGMAIGAAACDRGPQDAAQGPASAASTTQPDGAAGAESAVANTPEPEEPRSVEATPPELPATASLLPLAGVVGVVATGGAVAVRALRS